MHLLRLYLRYFPPALRLEYALSSGQVQRKTIDLPHVSAETNLQLVVGQLLARERLLPRTAAPKLNALLHRLVDKQLQHTSSAREPFRLHSTHRPHSLPTSNFASSKHARLVATCSYDKTIKLLRPLDPQRLVDDRTATLLGHDGVVFCVAFNRPHANLLLSGSFDKTCRVWDVDSRAARGVYRGATTWVCEHRVCAWSVDKATKRVEHV